MEFSFFLTGVRRLDSALNLWDGAGAPQEDRTPSAWRESGVKSVNRRILQGATLFHILPPIESAALVFRMFKTHPEGMRPH